MSPAKLAAGVDTAAETTAQAACMWLVLQMRRSSSKDFHFHAEDCRNEGSSYISASSLLCCLNRVWLSASFRLHMIPSCGR